MAEAENTRTRSEVTKRSFLNEGGEYTGRATSKVKGFRIELVESGQVFEHALADFDSGVLAAAAAFGLVTSITNTVGGKSLSAEERVDLIQDRIETLLEGEWSAERQSGPRSSQLLEALVRVRADSGKETTQEWKDKMALVLRDSPEKAKEYMANPLVAAALADIKAKAALERAKQLAAKSKAAPAEAADFMDD
jgi:hypothetical protein